MGSVPGIKENGSLHNGLEIGDQLRLAWGLLISLEVSVLAFCALGNIPLGSPVLRPAEHPEELSLWTAVGILWTP